MYHRPLLHSLMITLLVIAGSGALLATAGAAPSAQAYSEQLSKTRSGDLSPQWKELLSIAKTGTPREIIQASSDFLLLLPHFGPAHLIRAEAYQTIPDNIRAEKDFTTALRDPALQKADRLSAQTSLLFILSQRGKVAQALEMANAILQETPNNVDVLQQKAVLLEKSGKLTQAERLWQRIPKLTRNREQLSRSHAARANLLAKMGKQEAALRALRKASLNAKRAATLSWDTRLRFARLYLKAKKTAQALFYLTSPEGELLSAQEVARNSQHVSYSSYLQTITRLGLELRRYPLATAALEKLNQQATRPADKFKWLSMMAAVAAQDSRKSDALTLYRRALTLKDDSDTRIRAADVAWDIGDYKTVTRLLAPVIRASKGKPEYQGVALQKRHCDALQKSGRSEEALGCIDTLIKQNPQNKSLLLMASEVAAKAGKPDAQKEYLNAAQSLTRPPSGAISVGYKKALKEQKRSKQQWYKKAYKSQKSFKAGYAYANTLLRTGKRDAAIILLSRLVKAPDASQLDKHRAYQSLGYAMAANGDFHGAATAWAEAEKLADNPALRVRRIWALYKGGNVDKAAALLGQVQLSRLSKREQATWYELRGLIRFEQGQYRDSLTAREYLVRISPTARHWAQLAESYIAEGDNEKADAALENAIAKSRGDKTRYILRRAALKTEHQQKEAATILLSQALQTDPGNPAIAEQLGQAYARLNMNRQAIKHLRKAVNRYQVQLQAGGKEAQKAAEKLPLLRAQLAQLNQGLTLTLSHSFSSGDQPLEPSSTAMLAPFQHEGGAFEINYQPGTIGYRNGRILQLFARAFWNTLDSTIGPDGDSLTAGIGLRYKPLPQQNLWLSVERLIASGSNSDDNWLLKGDWRRTHGGNWQETIATTETETRSARYSDLQLHVGKLLENTAPTLAYAEGRYGQTWLLSENWLATPYLYLRGDGEFSTEDNYRVDAGAGITAKFRGAFDYYEGYKIDNEFYLRLGQTIDSNQAEEDFRATMGFKFSY